eukprot:INCI17536.7.p1 GENE.INCI17536.7~~INCI17536.7.p1  ORF type:complete len:859 (+),score=106.03 INCI17536.7:189-2579(+)
MRAAHSGGVALCLLVVSLACASVCQGGSIDPIQADDWLVAPVTTAPQLVETTIGGVPALQLTNGLISRTFAMPPAPPMANGSSGCLNPGGRRVYEPDGSSYPYFGSNCSQDSDCGQCILDKACRCNLTGWGSRYMYGAHCCVPTVPIASWSGFATAALQRQGHAGVSRASGVVGAQLLRATSPEAVIVLDGISYGIGGLVGQGDFAFLNTSLLQNFSADPSAFVFRPPHRTVSATQKRYEWTPGQRHSDANAAWPPSGLSVELDFVAPPSAVAAHAGVVVTVVYEIYTGIPVLSKWLRVSSNATTAVVIDALTMEQLHCTEAAVGYWPQSTDGLLTAGTTTGRVRLSSEFTRDKGSTTKIGPDSRCTTCTQGSGQTVLSSGYNLGPGAQVGGPGSQAFHGPTFESFHSYLLVHDSDDLERQGLAVRRMYRTLAPQITENPVFMHLTNTTPAGVRSAVDQCNASGFEMIIMSFGTSLNMESKDPAYIAEVAESVAYAHSQNIEIGGYNLMAASRTVAPGGNCVDADGKPDGAACLASDWSDDYFATIQAFIEATNFDMIETDGPYEGYTCASTSHSHHRGYNDSMWTQYERNMDFYAWCRARGMYIHAPDPFYMRGINKDGMGYVEENWNLPLWEQINLARQNVFDGTWSKIPSQGWMFVPIDQYHGGWPECCIEPVGFLSAQWEWYLAMYFGTGVSPCFRGHRLYDPNEPASLTLLQRWTSFNSRYRVILHSDIIHLIRADGVGFDAMLHVQPDPTKSKERALLMVFNPNDDAVSNVTLHVPLYYSGIGDVCFERW